MKNRASVSVQKALLTELYLKSKNNLISRTSSLAQLFTVE